MESFIEHGENHPVEIELNPCPRCRQAIMQAVAQAHSLFLPVTHYLIRCTNESCGGYGWIALRRDDGQPIHALVSMHPGLSRETLETMAPYAFHLPTLEAKPDLPGLFNNDFVQAFNCFRSGFHDAAVCMARRALERALLGKGAQSRAKLSEMVGQLSKQGKLPFEARTLCDEIREYGNLGAHPNEPLSEEDARNAIFFTDTVIAWLYGFIVSLPGKNSQS